jgi:hypothetical protein
MWVNLKSIFSLVFLTCLLSDAGAATAPASRAPGVSVSNGSSDGGDQMIQPSDVFKDFPELRWGMSFEDAGKAIEKTGAHPVGRRGAKTELAWDGTFDGMSGRATVLFKEGSGAYEIAVIVHAFDKRKEVFERWVKLIVERHGAAKEAQDNSIDASRVWRLKDGVALELRLIKDDDSPVIDIHWVKEEAGHQ